MNFTKTMFALAIGSVGIMGSMSASAVTLANGDVLSIAMGPVTLSGAATTGTTSWFAMDQNADSKIALGEKVALGNGTGIVIGSTAVPTATGSGYPNGGLGGITAPWNFFGNTGTDYAKIGITQTSATTLDMSGWTVAWNGIAAIPMGTGAWNPLNAGIAGTDAGPYSNGVGILTWNGNYGSAYTLSYTATVPLGDPSGFGGVKYALHLSGVVTAAAVPEASTYGMMLAGLGLVGGMVARRRKVI